MAWEKARKGLSVAVWETIKSQMPMLLNIECRILLLKSLIARLPPSSIAAHP